MKVFFDTNVLVSAVATRGLCADVLHAVVAEHQLVISETVLSEVARVLAEKLGVPREIVHEVEAFLRQEALVVTSAPALGISVRDIDDVAVLEEAVGGQAEALVTGDHDLLALAGNAPLPILSPRELWEALRTGAK